VPDSTVTILRSADPIHLTVTVPIPEDRLQLPFFPRRRDLPGYVTDFNEKLARELAEAQPTDKLIAALMEKKLDGAPEFSQALVSAAFLYDYTGEGKYLDIARTLLGALPDAWKKHYAEWQQKPVRPISSGIITGSTLSLGWRLCGTQRSPYLYGSGGNERGGSMSGVANAFDMLSPQLDEAFRKRFIEELLLPAAIQARNHYIGPGNQQSTANQVTLYGGLAARNWPLVSFAYSAEHGLLGNIEWGFDDDGLCLEGHYQSYTIRPILWATELLYGRGVNLYDRRLYTIVHSKGAEAIGVAWNDSFMRFIDEQRFPPDLMAGEKKTDGYHLTGSTLLKWQGLEVAMNWGTHIMRGSHDRCALTIRTSGAPEKHPLRSLGGGSYNHSSFGQSIIIVDEGLQNSVAADVLSFDVEGPVQHIMAASDKHYPGSVITRLFALLDGSVLVVDRVVNDRPRTVDWFLKGAGAGLSVATEERKGSWTAKADDRAAGVVYGGGVSSHRYARTDESWQEGGGRMIMLGAPATEILTWNYGERGGSCDMMVRRRDTVRTEFIAFFSTDTQSVERVPVRRADGTEADAVGVKVSLKSGKTFCAIVNYEPQGVEVALGALKTRDRFATDY
jgi:hypothetical protein